MRSGLACKSFIDDLPRVRVLTRSILEHNNDDLPVTFFVPDAQRIVFRNTLPRAFDVIAEEEFVEPRCYEWLDGWRQQQVVKLCLHRLGLYDRFLVVDSDNYFIRDFSEADLFGAPGEMRIVATTENYAYGAEPEIDALALGLPRASIPKLPALRFGAGRGLMLPRCFLQDTNYKMCPPDLAAAVIPYAFDRQDGKRVRFLPTPFIWMTPVLKALDALLAEEGVTYVDLIHLSPWEVDWYGNFAFKFFGAQMTPVRPLFLHFTLDEHLQAARQAGVTHATLARNFLGVALAARHQLDHEL